MAAAFALLFVASTKADYIQDHWLTSGTNYNTSTLSDSAVCGSSWTWGHKVYTNLTFTGSPAQFTTSWNHTGWETYGPDDVVWQKFEAFDNYGGWNDDWSAWGFNISVNRFFQGLSDYYDSNGYSNPIVVRSLFAPTDPCMTDSYHVLYGF